ncbi:hypothetical protein I8I24_004783, partial [Enterobacter cloacae]|nr:hypothetical protein [Enterobacter cloacae]
MYVIDDNYLTLGLKELARGMFPTKNFNRMVFVKKNHLLSKCTCNSQIWQNYIIIPISENTPFYLDEISLEDSVALVKWKLRRIMQTINDQRCIFCFYIGLLTTQEREIITLTAQESCVDKLSLTLGRNKKIIYSLQLNVKKKLGFKTRAQFLLWCKKTFQQ